LWEIVAVSLSDQAYMDAGKKPLQEKLLWMPGLENRRRGSVISASLRLTGTYRREVGSHHSAGGGVCA